MTTRNSSEGGRLEKMLKNEAKMLHRSVKAGNQEALHRVAPYFKAPEGTTLQQIQLVVAREHGLDSWKKLKAQAHAHRRPVKLVETLDNALTSAFKAAAKKRHRYFTVEHALLVLLELPDVVDVLSHVGCDVDRLRQQLARLIENENSQLLADVGKRTQPAIGFERVMQTAVWHVQFAEKEVTATNVLVSIYSHESEAVDLLMQQNVTRIDIVDYLMSEP